MHGVAHQEDFDPLIQTGRRSAARLRLSFPAKIRTLCETHDCVLLDLSQTGARISIEQPLEPGDAGMLRFADVNVFACVVRQQVGMNGLEFDPPLSKDQVVGMRHFAENFEANQKREFRREVRNWVKGGH